MKLPVGLPTSLHYLENVDGDQEILKQLVQRPNDLVDFFESASADEAWALEHMPLMQQLFTWLTQKFYQGILALEAAARVLKAVHAHHRVLTNAIGHNLTITNGKESYEVNSLLFGMSSPLFLDMLRRQGHSKVYLENVSSETLSAIAEYVRSGEVDFLWKKDAETIFHILQQAADNEVLGLVEFCAREFKRYLHKGNVLHLLKVAHQNGWHALKAACIDFTNQEEVGLKAYGRETDVLGVEFLNYRDFTLAAFDELHDAVTHLSFHDAMTEDSRFRDVINRVPALKGLDISQTEHYSDWLTAVPSALEELDLSMCPWLGARALEAMIKALPRLRVLKLNSNYQLGYEAWPLLSALPALEQLEVARCHQIDDEVLHLITSASSSLTHIDIEECHKLTDASIIDMARNMQDLRSINASRTELTDPAIIELASQCRNLKLLNLTRCPNITNRGVAECVQNSRSLRELNLTRCNISDDVIAHLKEINPYLHINR